MSKAIFRKKKHHTVDSLSDDVQILEDDIMALVSDVVQDVDGFVGFSENLIDRFSRAINGDASYNGIIIDSYINENAENVLDIDLSVVLRSHRSTKDICFDIKRNVVDYIKKYRNILVSHVNIYVASIERNKK